MLKIQINQNINLNEIIQFFFKNRNQSTTIPMRVFIFLDILGKKFQFSRMP